MNLIDLSDEIVAAAIAVDPPSLRPLDAIHLATAFSLRAELEAFVAYDRRLVAAADAAGLPVITPA